ncbi:MAG: sugar ABC transporter substrate-binding protein [Schleiferilactobacillus harbinensis]|jgi:multiple sugar transport system substrate-binding protein|nr:sugar ABC transporter substrate-binding protein [Schleiferilactobacillus harbinensis]MCI1914009.1 sugar ABC transporter substrate-binding protein [Schleiferilactobacillus harbinensis]
MKRNGLLGITVMLAAAVLVGCGSGNSAGSSSSGKVTLSFASWDTKQAVGLRKMADKFEKDNPNIKIKMETTPWDQYWTKMEAATTGGKMPDVVTMHSNESYKYMSNDMLMSLEDMAKKGDIKFSNYNSGVTKLYMYKGKHYAVPKDVTNIGLWYNKTLFDQAGVKYPDDTWTWETFAENAKKLTNAAKGVYGFAAATAPETGYYNFIYQNDGQIWSMNEKKSHYNDKNTVGALQFYQDLMLKDKVSPSAQVLEQTDQINLFESGKVAMIMAGNWGADELASNEYTAKNADVAMLPKGKKQATVTNGLSWGISAKTAHPKEAQKFLKFLASKEANTMQSDLGVSIPAYEGLGQGWTDKYKKTFAHIDIFNEQLKYGVLRPFNADTIKCETLSNEQVGKMMSGKQTAQETADTVAKGIDKIIAGKE